ncbi:MAG: carbonic anhydrase [SAR86 cluster bacterium]|uniref:Carbonic anhydrase n=1 Tax=SAR86 cluster bacterium TaxID=2030880 RepID=A0A2A4XD81_9GAMM|nr:MAG: carbonic anhydrase [SAR86 cluster bacterium]
MEKVISGFLRFKSSEYVQRKQLFADLANGQNPEVLFITCADSRIDPNMVTQTEPGDLFIIRNAGNIVPPHSKQAGGVTASIEFAVAALGVRHIVICGHTDCGAMKGALNPAGLDGLPHVQEWLDHSRAAVDVVKAKHGQATIDELSDVTEENVLLQMQHLRTHPAVLSPLSTGDVDLHGWVYDIEHGTVNAYCEDKKSFVPVEERYADLIQELAAAEESKTA